jgi:hypothetical protein
MENHGTFKISAAEQGRPFTGGAVSNLRFWRPGEFAVLKICSFARLKARETVRAHGSSLAQTPRPGARLISLEQAQEFG